jgi:hypothetical protein
MSVSGIALFCDDVRREVGGRETLIGVLPDATPFPRPMRLQRLVVYYRVKFEVSKTYSETIQPQLEFNGEAVDVSATTGPMPISLINQALQRGKNQNLSHVTLHALARLREPLFVEKDSRIDAILNVGAEKVICGTLNFILDPSIASSRPSLQSPPGVPPS